MTQLYSRWALVYHEMYAAIFDYKRDFLRFNSILKKYGCKNILELGCGTGRLAPYFHSAGYDYAGLDAAGAMIAIAREEVPYAQFRRGDMRRFSVAKKFEAIVISGRSFSYMTTNQDVRAALKSIREALKPGGILAFDNFDATQMFARFRNRMTENIRCGHKRFIRESTSTPSLKTGWTWNWDAHYTVHDGKTKTIFRDQTILRAFTPDEIRLFLMLSGFETLRISRRNVTLLTVARKSAIHPKSARL